MSRSLADRKKRDLREIRLLHKGRHGRVEEAGGWYNLRKLAQREKDVSEMA